MSEVAVATESKTATLPYFPEETGSTIDQAFFLLKRAKSVYVAVPRGYDRKWDFFRVSKAEAKKHLAWLAETAERDAKAPLFASRSVNYYGDISLYLGSVYD